MSTTTPHDPIRTMSAAAHHGAQWALLDELADLLEMTQEQVESVRDDRVLQWPDADAVSHIGQINACVEALDALGPREFEEDPPADAPEDEKREGENR